MRAAPLGLAATLLLGGCAHTPPDEPADPLEPVNRKIYAFNETADRYVLRPVAKGYDAAVPGPARTGIRNFFNNLFYPTVIVNDLLQLKLKQAAHDFARFTLNTTFGLAGFIDVATPGGLYANDEDFGQTLGYWGLGPGWYLVLPFLGPSNNRDLVGSVGDGFTNPLNYAPRDANIAASALNLVDKRAGYLSADRFLEQQLDRYVFIRSIHLQQRLNLVHDGNPPREDFGFEDEEFNGPEVGPDTELAPEQDPAESAPPADFLAPDGEATTPRGGLAPGAPDEDAATPDSASPPAGSDSAPDSPQPAPGDATPDDGTDPEHAARRHLPDAPVRRSAARAS